MKGKEENMTLRQLKYLLRRVPLKSEILDISLEGILLTDPHTGLTIRIQFEKSLDKPQ